MEKTFHRMANRPSARHAYVRAEISTALAHQIRAIRLSRGLTQFDLAKLLKTTQAAISRLEDASYGRISIKTLYELAEVFDTGLEVRFSSFVTMLQRTFVPDAAAREVPSFEQEKDSVCFISTASVKITSDSFFNVETITSDTAQPSYHLFTPDVLKIGHFNLIVAG
jgi:transcriptional regulator with XRE-family HTH domain